MTTRRRADIAVLGAGSATASFVRALRGDHDVVVFEPDLVGGECPYDACIPSKGLLHDGRVGRSWEQAGRRRRDLVHHRDDSAHVEPLIAAGVELIRERATIVDPGRVRSDSVVVEVDHIVIATGASPVIPPIDGLDRVRDRIWTTDEALRTTELPQRLAILGGGVVGCEFTQLFSSFGVDVVVFEPEDRLFGDLDPAVSDAIMAVVRATGALLRLGRRPERLAPFGDGVAVTDDHGDEHRVDRVLVATGRRPRLDGVGLESLGLPVDLPLPLDAHGRVRTAGSVWAIGDASGLDQYTHAASHHGRVVADHLGGDGVRRVDDVVSAACMFTEPPLMTVGPTRAATADDPDVVWVSVDVADTSARAATDELEGALAVAGSRRTGRIVAAHGIGSSFDELVHAVVVAIDGDVPIDRLLQSMVPFPTMGDVWHAALERLAHELA